MEAVANLKYLRISPRKVKIVLDLIRGKDVGTAAAILMQKLYVSACYANPGPIIKRIRPRAQGRAFRINKRTSHVTIVVSER